jgi:hypothetical protein
MRTILRHEPYGEPMDDAASWSHSRFCRRCGTVPAYIGRRRDLGIAGEYLIDQQLGAEIRVVEHVHPVAADRRDGAISRWPQSKACRALCVRNHQHSGRTTRPIERTQDWAARSSGKFFA